MKRIHRGIPPIGKTELIPEPHVGNDTFSSVPGGDIAGYHQPLERIKDTECIAGPSRRKSATPLQATRAGPIARPPRAIRAEWFRCWTLGKLGRCEDRVTRGGRCLLPAEAYNLIAGRDRGTG